MVNIGSLTIPVRTKYSLPSDTPISNSDYLDLGSLIYQNASHKTIFFSSHKTLSKRGSNRLDKNVILYIKKIFCLNIINSWLIYIYANQTPAETDKWLIPFVRYFFLDLSRTYIVGSRGASQLGGIF